MYRQPSELGLVWYYKGGAGDTCYKTQWSTRVNKGKVVILEKVMK